MQNAGKGKGGGGGGVGGGGAFKQGSQAGYNNAIKGGLSKGLAGLSGKEFAKFFDKN